MFKLFFATLGMAVLGACATTITTAPQAPSSSASSIVIFEGGCFYKCTTYEITVHADGRYQINGRQMTRTAGVSEGQLGAAAFAAAEKALSAANFQSLPTAMSGSDPSVWKPDNGVPCMHHLPGLRITRKSADGQEKTVHWNQGCRSTQMSALRDELRKAIRYNDLIRPAE